MQASTCEVSDSRPRADIHIISGVLTFSMRSSDSIVFSRNIFVLSLMAWTF